MLYCYCLYYILNEGKGLDRCQWLNLCGYIAQHHIIVYNVSASKIVQTLEL